jgi:predicted DNA-binding transcriptional regulator YafY
MDTFPLYDQMKDASDKDLTSSQKSSFMKKIQSIDQDGMELVYALIRVYHRENSEIKTFAMPYEGQVSSEGVTFNLLELPKHLRQILYRFLNTHLKKIEEDQQLSIGRDIRDS